MKLIGLLILGFASSLLAATNDILLVTTRNRALTTDIFTRDGQTNLVRRTWIGGTQEHRFYRDGAELGLFKTYSNLSKGREITFKAGLKYDCSILLNQSNEVQQAMITTTNSAGDLLLLDAFGYTNGVFYPQTRSYIQNFNEVRGVR